MSQVRIPSLAQSSTVHGAAQHWLKVQKKFFFCLNTPHTHAQWVQNEQYLKNGTVAVLVQWGRCCKHQWVTEQLQGHNRMQALHYDAVQTRWWWLSGEGERRLYRHCDGSWNRWQVTVPGFQWPDRNGRVGDGAGAETDGCGIGGRRVSAGIAKGCGGRWTLLDKLTGRCLAGSWRWSSSQVALREALSGVEVAPCKLHRSKGKRKTMHGNRKATIKSKWNKNLACQAQPPHISLSKIIYPSRFPLWHCYYPLP